MRALTEFVAGRKNDADFYNYGNKPSREGCKYTAVNERSDGSFEFRVFRAPPIGRSCCPTSSTSTP
jgi:hypothetical protein